MSNISWIGPDDKRLPEHAIGFVTAAAMDNVQGILVVVTDSDGEYHVRAFGEMLKSDTALVGAMLSYEAARQMFEDD